MTNTVLSAGPDLAVGTPSGLARPAPRVSIPLRRTGWVVLGLQFVVMAVWSDIQYSHFALTQDAGTYIQAFHLISRGDLNPYSSTLRHAFASDHLQLSAWPLSLLDWLGPQGMAVLWAQDLCVVLAEAAAFAWMRSAVTGHRFREDSALTPNVVLGVGLLLLVADPWIYWAIAGDVHIEPFALPVIVMAAYEFSRGRDRRAWIWVAISLLSGDVAATYVAGLGISALLAARFTPTDRRAPYWTGFLLIGAAGAATLLITAVGGNRGSTLTDTYGFLAVAAGSTVPKHLGGLQFLKGVAEHPANIVKALWRARLNVYGNLAETGWIGALTPWTFGVPVLVLLENCLEVKVRFSFPSYQSLPVYLFCPVGIVVMLAWAAERFRLPKGLGVGVVAVLVVNALFWGAIWIPAGVTNWLRVSNAQATVLSDALRQIPANAEVIVSQGVVGPFANRAQVHSMEGVGSAIPVSGSTVFFVVAPSAGIETIPVNKALNVIYSVAGPLGATLIAHGHGVWVFRWHRPPNVHEVAFANQPPTLAAWALSSKAGRVDLSGPASSWHVSSSGSAGYLVYGDYWSEPTGHYVASVALSTATRVNVEVWDATSNRLLARRTVAPTNGLSTVTFPFVYSHSVPRPGSFGGIGPFSVKRVAPPTDVDQLEIRVWTHAGGSTDVYTVGLVPAK